MAMRFSNAALIKFGKKAYVTTLVVSLLFFSAICISSYADRFNFNCQLLSHLKLLWLLLIALLALGLLAVNRKKWFIFGGIVWAANFAPVGLLWLPQSPKALPKTRTAASAARLPVSSRDHSAEKYGF